MSFNSKDFKGFTFRSGPVSKKTKSFSSFWDNSVDDYDVDEFLGNDVNKPLTVLITSNFLTPTPSART